MIENKFKVVVFCLKSEKHLFSYMGKDLVDFYHSDIDGDRLVGVNVDRIYITSKFLYSKKGDSGSIIEYAKTRLRGDVKSPFIVVT